jgi:hypothetical protein
MTLYPKTKALEGRITIFSRVISIMFMLFGIGAAIAQLAKISPFLESYPGWTWNLSNISALILGILLFLLGKSQAIKRLVHFSLFSGRETMKRFLLVFPIFATIILLLLKFRLGDSRSYRMILDEGGFIEYGTVIAYFLAGGFSIPIGRSFFRLRRKVLGWGYYLYSAFFIFVALEEVSWGQRLFGWELPHFFEAYNVQGEFTIHNLVWFQDYWGEGIIGISFICLLGIIFWYRSHRQKEQKGYQYLTYLVPSWFLAIFFTLALVIYVILEYTDGLGFVISRDQEFAELLLSLGFLFFVIVNYFRQVFEFGLLKPRAEDRELLP